jgi:hypothetical protein
MSRLNIQKHPYGKVWDALHPVGEGLEYTAALIHRVASN